MLAAVASVTFTFREAQASTCEWQIVNPPDPAPSYNGLGGLAAIAANDVWVSGVAATTPELQIQHFNGSTWTQVPTRALPLSAVLVSMAAVSTDSVWAVGWQQGSNGDAAFISHWDGFSWSVVNNPAQNFNSDLYSVIATGKNDIWASGDISPAPFTHQALVEHYDGHKWQMYNLSGGTVLQAIAGTSNRDVWAGGSGTGLPGALVYQWEQSSRSWVMYPNTIGTTIQTMSAHAPNDIWAVGPTLGYPGPSFVERWNGRAWTSVSYPRTNYNSLVAHVDATSASGDVWFAGSTLGSSYSTGFVDRFNRHGFKDMHITQAGSYATVLNSISGVPGTSDVWTVGFYSNSEGVLQNLAERYTCGAR
jgi:hypothetical protein